MSKKTCRYYFEWTTVHACPLNIAITTTTASPKPPSTKKPIIPTTTTAKELKPTESSRFCDRMLDPSSGFGLDFSESPDLFDDLTVPLKKGELVFNLCAHITRKCGNEARREENVGCRLADRASDALRFTERRMTQHANRTATVEFISVNPCPNGTAERPNHVLKVDLKCNMCIPGMRRSKKFLATEVGCMIHVDYFLPHFCPPWIFHKGNITVGDVAEGKWGDYGKNLCSEVTTPPATKTGGGFRILDLVIISKYSKI